MIACVRTKTGHMLFVESLQALSPMVCRCTQVYLLSTVNRSASLQLVRHSEAYESQRTVLPSSLLLALNLQTDYDTRPTLFEVNT